MRFLKFGLFMLLLLFAFENASAQRIEMLLEERMISLERDVVRIYNELQKFLYEDTRRGNELLAFEAVMRIYVDEILNLYDTLWRLKGTTLESHKNIAARCLIFRALTYLERATENSDNYARACEDYKRALRLAHNDLKKPLLSTELPHEVWIGHKLYTRLADLLDNRSKNFQMLDCFRISNKLLELGEGK